MTGVDDEIGANFERVFPGDAGIFVQERTPDADPSTSEGVFVGFVRPRATYPPGTVVRLEGRVVEQFNETRVNLTAGHDAGDPRLRRPRALARDRRPGRGDRPGDARAPVLRVARGHERARRRRHRDVRRPQQVRRDVPHARRQPGPGGPRLPHRDGAGPDRGRRRRRRRRSGQPARRHRLDDRAPGRPVRRRAQPRGPARLQLQPLQGAQPGRVARPRSRRARRSTRTTASSRAPRTSCASPRSTSRTSSRPGRSSTCGSSPRRSTPRSARRSRTRSGT